VSVLGETADRSTIPGAATTMLVSFHHIGPVVPSSSEARSLRWTGLSLTPPDKPALRHLPLARTRTTSLGPTRRSASVTRGARLQVPLCELPIGAGSIAHYETPRLMRIAPGQPALGL
jgi:hypothetical protein